MRRNGFLGLLVLVILIGLVPQKANAQASIQDSTISTFILSVVYSYQIPGGDMSDRYGHNSTIGPAITYKTDKNWMWTVESNFIFGNDVKESAEILEDITTEDGNIVGLDGIYANVRPQQRGFSLLAKTGKILPAFNLNPNSGLFFNLGIGYIQHHIRWDIEGNNVPQLGDDYKKGYDRFSEGIVFTQDIGLFYMGDNRLWNFKVSAEATEAFTTMKRYNFDTMGGEDKNRLDLFFGLKISWMVPLHSRAPKAIYYN